MAVIVEGVLTALYQLRALLYKNFVLGKRLWRSTLCHLLIPCLMVVIFGVIATATASNGEVRVSSPFVAFASSNPSGSDLVRSLPKCRVFDSNGGRYGKGVPIPGASCTTLAYAPATAEVNLVMSRVALLNKVTHSPNFNEESDVVGFETSDALNAYALANPGRIGHGVVFADNFVVNVNESLPLDPSGVPTIPIEVLYNKSAVGNFYGNTGDDLMVSNALIVSTPLQIHRAVVEAILSLHAGSLEADLSFDVGKHVMTSSQPATSSLDTLAGIFVYLGIMIPFVLTIRHVVAEKENTILDAMRVSGLHESMYWFSWFVYFATTSLVSTLLMYVVGLAMGTPIFVYVDSSILIPTIYFYFLATLCLALFLSSVIPTTKMAIMVGFCFLALGLVIQAVFTQFEFLTELVYDPYILPPAALRTINLYPPILFSRLMTDFSFVIAPYIVEGSKLPQRNRYTMADFTDGVYRYGRPTNPLLYSLTNATSCIDNPLSFGGVKCNAHTAGCPINTIGPCPSVSCSSDWGMANNGTDSCARAGGVLASASLGGPTSCVCRYVTSSDQQNMSDLVGLIVLYLVLAWYFGQVLTYGHGRAEPFYFPLLPWYWFPSLKKKTNWQGIFGSASDPDVLFEEKRIQSGELDASHPVIVRGLKKVYPAKRFTAVNGLSFAMEKGKCFALLGHNGAGKTTAIKMISGLISITDGDVLVDGLSVRDSLSNVRQYIGVCPQHDILWPELSAYEHLKFFGMFQGMDHLEEQIHSMLQAVRLDKEGSHPSSSFSGGMKRRLSVAIASLGDKRVVILDEPTTGMDPQNRSHVWKMISDLKQERVVLLTTHSMEEAEFLGDNIGIMSSGRLIALGSTLRLKSKFGGGYRLKLVVPSKEASRVRAAVTQYVSEAILIDQSAGDISYDLPGSADRQLPELFRWIERQKGVLNDWAVSQVSLEDIFIRLTKEAHPAGIKDNPAALIPIAVVADGDEVDRLQQAEMDHEALDATAGHNLDDEFAARPMTQRTDADAGEAPAISLFSAYKSQARGICCKTYALHKRNRWTLACQCILPLLLVCIIFAIKFSVESSLAQSNASGNNSGPFSDCTRCMREATSALNSTQFNIDFANCLSSNVGFEENCASVGSGIFRFKNITTRFTQATWDGWLSKYTGFDYRFNPEQDLVEANPVYAFCLERNQFLQTTCLDYASAVNGSSISEPANYFSANPMGLSTQTPLRYMVVAPPGQDVGYKCFNNGSTPLFAPDFRNVTTFLAEQKDSLPQLVDNVQGCSTNNNGDSSAANRGRQIPALSSSLNAALGTDATSHCDVIIRDTDAVALALANTQLSGAGLMRYFPSEIVEGVSRGEDYVVFANPLTAPGMTEELVFGTYNLTASCSNYFFMNIIATIETSGPLSAAAFASFVTTERLNTNSQVDLGLPTSGNAYFTSSWVSKASARLDACVQTRRDLMHSPALCPLESYLDSLPALSQPTLQGKVDKYMFDMQEAVKNEQGFAAKPRSLGVDSIHSARMEVMRRFPDATLVVQAFDPARGVLKFSMQGYYKKQYGNSEYAHANLKVKRCHDSYINSNAPTNGGGGGGGGGSESSDIESCKNNPDLAVTLSPGLLVEIYQRFWGRAHDQRTIDGRDIRLAGEETFILNGIATAALRYISANGLNEPSSPVTDPNTRLLLGVRPFPYKVSTAAEQLAILEEFIAIMVSMLIPFAVSMLWPVFAFSFVHEKELKLRAMQSMMGMRTDCYFLVNYVFDFLVAFAMLILIYILCFFMSLPVARSEGTLIMLLFFIWANTLVALAFLFQTFFSRTRTSNVILYLLLLGGVVGAFILNTVVFTSTFAPAPAWYLIWPPFVMYRAIHLMTKRTYYMADLSPADELGRLYGILVLQTIIMFLAAFYLDIVIPREYGRPRHPLFFLGSPYRMLRRKLLRTMTASRVDEESPDVEKGLFAATPDDDQILDQDVLAERTLVETKQYTQPPAVEIVHLRKVYASGKVAVEDVTLHMEKGEVFCLLGPNGAGKSTVIGVLTGLFSGSKGKASINGFDVETEMHRIYERLGVTPQFDTLWPSLTVMEHLVFYSRLKGVPQRGEFALAVKAAKAVRLENALQKKSSELSGGMRRRLSLAISLVGDPLTIFLDEPTTGLDPETRRQVWQLIEREKRHRCIVLTTHSMEEAEALASRVAIMAHGLVKTVGTTMQLKSKYGDGYRIQVGFTAGNEGKVDTFMASAIPSAVLAESRAGLKVYKVSKEQSQVSAIFDAFLDRNVEASGVEDWGIEQATLEQVFLKIAAESERVYGTA